MSGGQDEEKKKLAWIPDDVQHIITGMACRKVHNGTESTHGLIICLDVDFARKIEGEVEKAIEEWVYNCLDQAHQALDFKCELDFVFNVLDDQWRLESDDVSVDVEPDEANRIQAAVHISGGFGPSVWPLFKENTRIPVDPAAVLAHFHTPPAFIRTVGISGVSERCLRDEWTEMIREDPTRFSRAGKGYMVHPMYTLPDQAQHGTIPYMATRREMSFNFGWENYPPSEWQ